MHGWSRHSGCASQHCARYLSECRPVPRVMDSTLIAASRIDVVGLSDRMPGQHATILRACRGFR